MHDEWRRRIQDAAETSTLHSTPFDGGWPDAPARTLRNSTVRAWPGDHALGASFATDGKYLGSATPALTFHVGK